MYVMVTALAVLKPRKSLIHKYGNLKYGMFIFFFLIWLAKLAQEFWC